MPSCSPTSEYVLKSWGAMHALQDKIAIVTGAGRGTGRALALKFASAGARLVINDVSEAPAAEVMQAIRDTGADAALCAGDITMPDFGDRFVATALQTFGGLDLVVNNASYVWPAMIDDMTDEQFVAMVDVNMTAPFRILRAAGRFFKSEAARAASYQRKVVNVSSVLAVSGGPTVVNYGSAKAGLNGITYALAREWGPLGVNVNGVGLGLIDTRLGTLGNARSPPIEIGDRKISFAIPPERQEAYIKRTALGRSGTPEEAAGGIYLLCLPEADYITGEVILVSGGQLR
jgi:3-oxoacyl-[acyl-carrier protein] reductase